MKLRVRVVGPVVAALSVPDRVKDRVLTVTRDVPMPWGIRAGDTVVLSPGEGARLLSSRRAEPPAPPEVSGEVRLDEADLDRDGYDEDVLSNAYVRAVLQPHRGGRLLSFVDGRGVDRLAQPGQHIMAGKYVLLGGAEDVIVESGTPGDLWNASLDRGPESGGSSVLYTMDLKSPEGVRFAKRAALEPDLPLFSSEVTLRYEGRKAERSNGEGDAGEGGDRKRLSYAVRLSTAVGEPDSMNVFHVPGPRGMRVVRFHRPPHGSRWRWRDWRNERFGLTSGFLLSRHEQLERPLLVLFGGRRALYASFLNDLAGPETVLRHRTATVAAGRATTFGVAFLCGDAAAAAGRSALVLSRSRSGGDLAVCVRTGRRADRLRASLHVGGRRRSLTLVPRRLGRAGFVMAGTLSGGEAAGPVRCRVAVGGDHLAAELEEL
jgi:hypothetical protein